MTASKNGYWRWVLWICALLMTVLIGLLYYNAKIACSKKAANADPIDFRVEVARQFPKGFVEKRGDCGELVNRWTVENLGGVLHLADEAAIVQSERAEWREGDFTIRVSHLPSFTHLHIVRVEKRGKAITLFGTRLGGTSDSPIPKVLQTKRVVLDPQQSEEFMNIYDDGLPGRIWTVFDYAVLDGTTIYLETYDSDGYRVLEETEGNYERLDKLAIFLIETLGWDPHPPRT